MHGMDLQVAKSLIPIIFIKKQIKKFAKDISLKSAQWKREHAAKLTQTTRSCYNSSCTTQKSPFLQADC
jgi:hypothetical protein